MVKRYQYTYEQGMEGHPEGQYVSHDDYEALQRQLDEARAHMRAMRSWMQAPDEDGCTEWREFCEDRPESADWDFGEGE